MVQYNNMWNSLRPLKKAYSLDCMCLGHAAQYLQRLHFARRCRVHRTSSFLRNRRDSKTRSLAFGIPLPKYERKECIKEMKQIFSQNWIEFLPEYILLFCLLIDGGIYFFILKIVQYKSYILLRKYSGAVDAKRILKIAVLKKNLLTADRF